MMQNICSPTFRVNPPTFSGKVVNVRIVTASKKLFKIDQTDQSCFKRSNRNSIQSDQISPKWISHMMQNTVWTLLIGLITFLEANSYQIHLILYSASHFRYFCIFSKSRASEFTLLRLVAEPRREISWLAIGCG